MLILALVFRAERPDFLSSIVVAKLAAEKLQDAGQRARAQRVIAEAGRLQAPPVLLQWLRAQPPSAAITGAASRLALAASFPDCIFLPWLPSEAP